MITLPELPYAFDALEPYIDAKTMEIHYTKHHQTYVDKLNAVLTKYPDLINRDIPDLLTGLPDISMEESDKIALNNNGGGHVNHSLFWKLMDPKNTADSSLASDITAKFGSVEEFKKQFSLAAMNRFGSGWVWLVRNEKSELELYSLPNQDSPYINGHAPIIGLDVWEHAYYLKYQNRRAEYIEKWWNTIKIL